MLPQVKNEEFVRLANKFRKEFLNSNEDEFVEYLSEQYPQLQVNPNKNSIKTKDAKKGFRYVLQQEANNVSESEWIVQNKHVYERTMESTNSSFNSLKRTIENGNLRESVAPMKKRKLDSSINDKEYKILSDEFIRDQLKNIAEFPESLIEKADQYFSNPDVDECTRIVLSGSQNCGKTKFVYYLSQKYGYQHVQVVVDKVDYNTLFKSFEGYFQEYEKVLLHFPFNRYNYKVAENFTCPSDCLSSKFVLIFEIDDHKSLKPCSDFKFIFPCAKEKDRLKFLNHFIKGIKLEDPLTVDTMKENTPGYQIGHIKNLCKLLKTYNKVTEEIFFDIVKSGEIKESFLDRPNVLWEDIGGHDHVKNQLMEAMETTIDDTENSQRNGILLYGPPGCGKTMLAKALCNELKFNFISVCCADVLSKYQGESEKKVRNIFREARECQPCIIFLDEIDALCAKRDDESSTSRNTIVNTFLTEIDGISSHKNSQLLIVGATNFVDKIDEAVSRSGRLGQLIEVNIPQSAEQRFDVLMAASKKGQKPLFGSCTLDQENFSVENIFKQISEDEYTKGWNHSDLASLIRESYLAMKRDINNDHPKHVTLKHVLNAFEKIKIHKKKENSDDSGTNNPPISLKLSITPVDDKILLEYHFNEQLMAQVESLMKDAALTYISIGGGPCSGKTTLIKYISNKYRYGLVSLSPNYFRKRNFNLEQLQNDLNNLLKENGRLMVHIVKENVPREVLNQILLKFKSDWLSRDILFVFEKTTISAADVVIPRLSDEEILRLLRVSVFIDVDLSKFVCHTKEWTRQQFVDLKTFRDSISTENDLLSKINLLNRNLKTLS